MQEASSMSLSAAKHNQFLIRLQLRDRDLLRPHLRYLDLRLGASLQRTDTQVSRVVFPITGAISVTTSAGGTSIQCAIVGREGVMGAWPDNGDGQSPYDAIVSISGAALELPMAAFHRAMAESTDLRLQVARANLVEMVRLSQTTACNATHSTECRMCRWMLEFHDRSLDGRFWMTQEGLAKMLGVQRTTVTLIAGKLQAVGALQWRRGRLTILDRGEVERRSCACYQRTIALAEKLYQPSTPGWQPASAPEYAPLVPLPHLDEQAHLISDAD
jgi:CRP-like cAMP-binding protein